MANSGILDCGVRYAYQFDESEVANCGLVIGAGSRDEDIPCSGVAHFVEHMLFKGTKKRNYFDLINAVESKGGEMNAYTSKEDIALYVTIQNIYFEEAISVLGEIITEAEFLDVELQKEKQVIIDEIGFYEDSPSELIFDTFEELLFVNHPVSNSILGFEVLVEKVTREDLLRFYEKYFVAGNVVFSYVGPSSEKDVVCVLNKMFQNVRKGVFSRIVATPSIKPFKEIVQKDTYQSHVIIGTAAYCLSDENKHALFLLNNILGGGSFNSILNLKLREENGLTYNVDSSFSPFSDTGVFTVYFGVEKSKVDTCIDIIHDIFSDLITIPFTDDELQKHKEQLIGALVVSYDNKNSLMIRNGKNILYYNKLIDKNDILKKIMALTPNDIQRVATHILNRDQLSYLRYD